MRYVARWLFYDIWRFRIGQTVYAADWTAISAIATLITILVAVLAIRHSMRLVRVQLKHAAELADAVAERDRLARLKAFDQEYLSRIFDVGDRVYHEVFDLVTKLALKAAAKVTSSTEIFTLSAESTSALSQAIRQLSGTTGAALHVLRASRRYRLPPNTVDAVFSAYEKLVQDVVAENGALVQEIVDKPNLALEILHGDRAQHLYSMNQFLKAATGRLIAMMFSTRDEASDSEFLLYIESGGVSKIPRVNTDGERSKSDE